MNASVRFNLLFYMLKSARKLLTTPVKKPAKKKDSGALDAVG